MFLLKKTGHKTGYKTGYKTGHETTAQLVAIFADGGQ